MKRVFAIATLTFKEAIREKILYNLIVFALFFIALGAEAVYFVIGDWERIVKDISLSSIEIFGILISVFLGVGLISREIDRKTGYTIISKPLPRASFVLGRYIGLILVLGLNSLIMLSALFVALWYARSQIELSTLQAFLLIFFQFMIISGFALSFSTFTTQTLGAIISLALYVVGHLSRDLKYFTSQEFPFFIRNLAKFLYYILPNLEILNLKSEATYNIIVSMENFIYAGMYGLFYTSLLILVSIIIFERRELK